MAASPTNESASSATASPTAAPGPRVGFVVSKAVGGSVVRHRVARRLRATMRAQLDSVPAGTDVVVRALPAASTATSAQLSEDIAGVLRKLSRP